RMSEWQRLGAPANCCARPTSQALGNRSTDLTRGSQRILALTATRSRRSFESPSSSRRNSSRRSGKSGAGKRRRCCVHRALHGGVSRQVPSILRGPTNRHCRQLRKMSPKGHAEVLALPLAPEMRILIDKVMARDADVLAELVAAVID